MAGVGARYNVSVTGPDDGALFFQVLKINDDRKDFIQVTESNDGGE